MNVRTPVRQILQRIVFSPLVAGIALIAPAQARVVVDEFTVNDATLTSMVVEAPGRVLAAASIDIGTQLQCVIVRVLANGGFEFLPGASVCNGAVLSLVRLPSGNLMIGGRFNTVGGHSRVGLAMLGANGVVMEGFNANVQANANGESVYRVLRLGSGKLLIGGRFVNVGNSGRGWLARLNTDGSVDTGFAAVTLGGAGPWIWDLAEQSDGKILIGGRFTQVNGVARQSLARLNADGGLDTTFAGGAFRQSGVGDVTRILIQPDGRIIVAGDFDRARDAVYPQWQVGNIVRFKRDGLIDYGFSTSGPDVNGPIHWAIEQPDRKIVIGGGFSRVGSLPPATPLERNRIARLHADGRPDSDFSDLAVTGGGVYAMVRQTDGRIVFAGDFSHVGGRPQADGARAVEVAASPEVPVLAAGGLHTCGTRHGLAWCWGNNSQGQLGSSGGSTSRWVPFPVVDGGSIVAMTSGLAHTCALTTAGAVKCWGSNSVGQLGDGTTTGRSTPVSVTGLSSGVQQIWAGDAHTCALRAGAVLCWGSNGLGQLGDGTSNTRLVPTAVSGLGAGVRSIALGAVHSCARRDSDVLCWGGNGSGQLGDGTRFHRITPVVVQQLPGPAQMIAAGTEHSCALVSGAVLCWGDNGSGQVGDGTGIDRLLPVQAISLPLVASVHAGSDTSCAITSTGAARCWGNNSTGQIGDGTTTHRLSAIPVSGLASGVRDISLGGAQTCATVVGGVARCWGSNVFGQLGDGTRVDRLVPTPIALPVRPDDVIFIDGFN